MQSQLPTSPSSSDSIRGTASVPRSLPGQQPTGSLRSWLPSWLGGSGASSSQTVQASTLTQDEMRTPPTSTTIEVSASVLYQKQAATSSGSAAAEPSLAGYDVTTKTREMNAARSIIMESFNDTQFIAVAETLTAIAGDAVGSLINELEDGKINKKLKSRREWIKDLVGINIFRGVGELSKRVRNAGESGHIPNYANQPALTNTLIYLCQRGASVLNEQAFADIDAAFRQEEEDFRALINRYPRLEHSLPLIRDYIKNTAERGFKAKVKDSIFGIISPHFSEQGQLKISLEDDFNSCGILEDDQRQLLAIFSRLAEKHNREKALFRNAADVLLAELFPNHIQSLMLPTGGWLVKIPGIRNLIYSLILGKIADFLTEQYQPIARNSILIGRWEEELRQRTGVQNIQSIVRAPAAMLQESARNYIRTDPSFVDFIVEKLEDLHPSKRVIVGDEQTNQRGEVLGKISQVQQAQSIIASIQSLMDSEDPSVLRLGRFMENTLGTLTTGLLAKGCRLVVNHQETIQPDEFLKVLLNRLNAYMRSTDGQGMSTLVFWRNFFETLPLPSLAQEEIVPTVHSKITEINAMVQAGREAATQTENRIRTYVHGEQLLSIIEQLSDHIVEHAVEENAGLVSTSGLDERFAELAEEFLPGITIDEEHKAWLKNNIAALSVETDSREGSRPLKEGIQVILRKALVNIIERNFDNSGGQYAAQLLSNIHNQSIAAFREMSDEEKQQISYALAIQHRIDDRVDQIKDLRRNMIDQPQDLILPPEQQAVMKEQTRALKGIYRADRNIHGLKNKRKKLLSKLNALPQPGVSEEAPRFMWRLEDLSIVHEAMMVLKSVDQTIHPGMLEEFRQNNQLNMNRARDNQERLKFQMVAQLIEMDTEGLKLLSDLVNLQVVLKHAQTDLEQKVVNYQIAIQASEEMERGFEVPQENWVRAKEWMAQQHELQNQIHDLSMLNVDDQGEVDQQIDRFRNLSAGMMELLGLQSKETLNLPVELSPLVNVIWPLIESAKNEDFARLLFEQIAPMLEVIQDIDANKAALQSTTRFLPHLAATVGQEVILKIPDLITSLKPFAENILRIAGNDHPSPEEIQRMEDALNKKLMALGKPGVTGNILKSTVEEFFDKKTLGEPEFNRRVNLLTSRIAQLLATNPLDEGVDIEQVAAILREIEGISGDSTDVRRLRKIHRKAQEVVKAVNHYLSYRGKRQLQESHLIEAYHLYVDQTVATQAPGEVSTWQHLPVDHHRTMTEALKQAELVEKIKDVVITPEEIAHMLNDLIPVATNFQSLVAPELQEMIAGNDPRFQSVRDFQCDYVEGMLLRRFVKMVNLNPDIGAFTQKLQELAAIPGMMEGRTSEEIAKAMIDKMLEDMVGIGSKDDLHGLAGVFIRQAYAKIKEQAYLNVTPLLLPLVEKERNRMLLDDRSGSRYLSGLCKTLSLDVVNRLPMHVKNYREVAKKVWTTLNPEVEPLEDQISAFAAAIQQLKESPQPVPVVPQEEVAVHQILSPEAREAPQSTVPPLLVKVTNRTLVEAYAQIINPEMTAAEKEALIETLKTANVKKEIDDILVSLEKAGSIIHEVVRSFGPEVQQSFAAEIQAFLNNPTAHAQAGEFISDYLEGVLLKLMLKVAENNPPVDGKDSIIVILEKLLNVTTRKYREARIAPTFEVIARGFEVEVHEILGLRSARDLEGLPNILQDKAFEEINGFITGIMKQMYSQVKAEPKTAAQIAEEADVRQRIRRSDRLETLSIRTLLTLLSEDISSFTVDIVPAMLSETVGDQMKGVSLISKGVDIYLGELLRGNFRIAQFLQNYPQTDTLQEMLRTQLTELSHPENPAEDKKLAAEMLSQNLIEPALVAGAEVALEFAAEHGADFERNLMANLLGAATDHFRTINRAKAAARARGVQNYAHQDLIDAAREQDALHAVMTMQPIAYNRSTDAIINALTQGLPAAQVHYINERRQEIYNAISRLVDAENKNFDNITNEKIARELAFITGLGFNSIKAKLEGDHPIRDAEGFTIKEMIRRDAESIEKIRMDEAYNPGSIKVLRAIRQKLPEQYRTGAGWKLAKKFAPVLVGNIVEQILNPDTINMMVLSGLEATRDNLNQSIVLTPPEARPVNDQFHLDQVSGDLMAEVLKNINLPNFIMRQMVDPVTGQVSDSMKESLGGTLREMLDGHFIEDKIRMAVVSTLRRDPRTGDYPLRFDGRPQAVKDREAISKQRKMQDDLRRVSREVVNSGISFYIRKTWAEGQQRFDNAISGLGPIGRGTKKALDVLFRFVFLTVIGNILALIFWPIKKMIQGIIYKTISLDENRESLLDVLRRIPEGQAHPESYVSFHENLIAKMGEGVVKAVNDALTRAQERVRAEAATQPPQESNN